MTIKPGRQRRIMEAHQQGTLTRAQRRQLRKAYGKQTQRDWRTQGSQKRRGARAAESFDAMAQRVLGAMKVNQEDER